MLKMDRYAGIRERLLALAQSEEAVKAVIAVGSSARTDTPADEYSDLDLIIVADEPEAFLTGRLPQRLERVEISFTEPTLAGAWERRLLYEGGLDVDMIVFAPEAFRQAVHKGELDVMISRGHMVLHDKMGASALLRARAGAAKGFVPMSAEGFDTLVNEFFFHVVWAQKKLRRGERWTAKMCIDAYMKRLLLQVLELDCCMDADVWHEGRFLDLWAGEETSAALQECFAQYDARDMARALAATAQLFARTARRAAAKHGYPYPQQAENSAMSYLAGAQSP